jgi:hypothetical protein
MQERGFHRWLRCTAQISAIKKDGTSLCHPFVAVR